MRTFTVILSLLLSLSATGQEKLNFNRCATEFPGDLYSKKNLESLSINNMASYCHMIAPMQLSADILKLTNLKSIHLVDSELPPEIVQLPKLEAINYDRFDPNIFKVSGLKELRITLDSSDVPEFNELLPKLTNLQVLQLGIRGSVRFPENITVLQNLTTLKYYGEMNGTIPETITRLTQLKDLDVHVTNMTEFPVAITRLKVVEHVRLRGQFTELPSEIGQMKSLRVFENYGSWLSSLPKSIGDLTNLEELQVPGLTGQGKGMKQLPKEIGRLKNLRLLNLGHHSLKSVPTSIGNLAALEELYLHSNQLTFLPSEIGNLSELKVLVVNSNKLLSLPETLGKLGALVKLEANLNQLSSMPSSINRLAKLEKLSAYRNTQLKLDNVEWSFPVLRELVLSSIGEKSFPRGILKLSNLEVLDLSSNSFSGGLPKEVYEMPKLNRVWPDQHR